MPTVVRGGGVDGHPWVFAMLSYFRKILPVLYSSRKGVYYRLWRCWRPKTSSKMEVNIGFYPKLNDIEKRRELKIFHPRHVEYDIRLKTLTLKHLKLLRTFAGVLPSSPGKNSYARHFKGKHGKLYIVGKLNKCRFRKKI